MTTPSVPKSTHRVERAENPVEEIVEEVEHVFEPRPGGMIDNWHKNRAQREAADRERANAAERIEEKGTYAVKVTQLSPEITAANVINIPSGATAMILPNAPYRYCATIIASATVILSKDNGQALGGIGYPLPANTPMVIHSRAQLYGFATAAVTVSVLAESYAPES